MLEGANNCYVRSDGIVTAVIGLDNAIVVVTEDAVLAMHRDHAQNVKTIVDRLKAARHPEATTHNRVYRPWGFYESLIHDLRFQVKRIVVNPGHKLSLQKHFHRAEHWVVVSGSALVTRDETTQLLRENKSIYLPLGSVHRLENPGRIPLALIEVQSGSYLGEDDIVQIGRHLWPGLTRATGAGNRVDDRQLRRLATKRCAGRRIECSRSRWLAHHRWAPRAVWASVSKCLPPSAYASRCGNAAWSGHSYRVRFPWRFGAGSMAFVAARRGDTRTRNCAKHRGLAPRPSCEPSRDK